VCVCVCVMLPSLVFFVCYVCVCMRVCECVSLCVLYVSLVVC